MDQPSSTESNAIIVRIKFKSASLDEFIGRYGADVSPGGIFIRTKQPVEVGTSLQFDFSLADGAPLLAGTGTVAWVRESDPARANNVPGMGLRFDKLTPESQHTHQLILAEKARKEGKASATPYPPTAFVAPAARLSPPPDVANASEPAVQIEPGPVNLAVTRPAPAAPVKPPAPAPVKPATPSPPSAVVLPGNFADTDEFSEGGKTEVSEKPLDYYLKEVQAAKAAEEGRRHESKTAEEAVPQSLLDEVSTGASSSEPITKSHRALEGYPAAEPMPAAAAPSNPEPALGVAEQADAAWSAHADASDADAVAVPSGEILPELSAGAPIEETPPEKTEELAGGASLPLAGPESLRGPEPLDLGTGREVSFGDDRPPSRDAMPSVRQTGTSGKTIALIAVAAAAAAFAAVYLAKTKPWQERAKPEQAPVATAAPEKAPVAAPVPVPNPAAEPPKVDEPAKPSAEQPPAQKPAAEEAVPSVAVAEKVDKKVDKPEKKEAEKVEEPESDTKAEGPKKVERPEKAERGGRESSKSSKAAKSAKWDDLPPAQAQDEIYRLVVRSSPISAEVLLDGEYFSRTPCERRILDPKKTFTVVIRKDGFEPQERTVGPSDNWTKKGEEKVLTVTASLKRMKASAASAVAPESTGEGKSDKKVEPPAMKPEAEPKAEAPKAPPKEPSKAEPWPEKPEPAKPVAAPADKPVSKPAPNFDEPAKGKE